MATLAYQRAQISGTLFATSAASAGGDKIAPKGDGVLMVTNGGGGSINVTVVVPGTTKYGGAQPDVVVGVGAGQTKLFGPFPNDLADPADGLVAITYSGVTTVTVAAITV